MNLVGTALGYITIKLNFQILGITFQSVQIRYLKRRVRIYLMRNRPFTSDEMNFCEMKFISNGFTINLWHDFWLKCGFCINFTFLCFCGAFHSKFCSFQSSRLLNYCIFYIMCWDRKRVYPKHLTFSKIGNFGNPVLGKVNTFLQINPKPPHDCSKNLPFGPCF